ncbi:zinc-binding dehydrogenase family oxidoreductase [Paramyrothecium foliicola]|nr:zinc-binding dehydrogenase family oxidoreductase [Paramyrothecium foliicola]
MTIVTEVGCLGVKPGLKIMDSSTPEGALLRRCWEAVATKPGGPYNVYWGLEKEDPSKLWAFFDWDSVEHHETFAKTHGEEVVGDLPKIDILSSASLDVVLLYFAPDISSSMRDSLSQQLQDTLAKNFDWPDVKFGHAWGLENDFPVRGKLEQSGLLLMGFIGWPSLDARTESTATALSELTNTIRKIEGLVSLYSFSMACNYLERVIVLVLLKMTVPPTMTALVARHGQLVKETIPTPTPTDHKVLVQVAYVAQNPTDVQSFDSNAFGDGAVLGCDFVGKVVQTSAGVSRVKNDDVVAGLIWGGVSEGLGAYGEYTLADELISFPVPPSVSPEQASTVPLAACTAQLALFSKDCLAIPKSSRETVLIWGGSSSVGQFAIQIAKHHGLTVFTTCSPRHHDLVKALGATNAFDYRDDEVSSKIREASGSNLRYVFDCIGNETSSELASQAISTSGGTLCTVRPGKANTEKVTSQTNVTDVLVWTAFLQEHRYGEHPSEDDHRLAIELFRELPELLTRGVIKPMQTRVLEGLSEVPRGFQENRDGKISNFKIVYRL